MPKHLPYPGLTVVHWCFVVSLRQFDQRDVVGQYLASVGGYFPNPSVLKK